MPYTGGKPTAIDVPPKSLEALAGQVKDLANFIDDELKQVGVSQGDLLNLKVLYVAPTKPRQGMVVYADGTHWNPGSGEGVYAYGSDGAWHYLEVAPSPAFLAFRAHMSTNQSIPATTFTKVNMDTTEWDTTGGLWDTTNKQLKVTAAGYWQFIWSVTVSSTTQMLASLFKNGTEDGRGIQIAVSSGTVGSQASGSLITKVAVNDVFDIRVNIGAIGTAFSGASSFFCGQRIA